jgi:anaerobic selenocysteine-containing dehydrogenase
VQDDEAFVRRYMSKYDSLWEYIGKCEEPEIMLTYEEIEKICGVPIDHSFLTYKKELSGYGYAVKKISMKNKTVRFSKV